jgi:hypothetical protein
VGGTAPSARRFHSAIYDPNGDRMLVYGGQTADSVASDLWGLTLSGSPAWTRIDAPGARPPATAVHSAVYDAARNRMLVLNGPNVWALSLDGSPTWSAYTPTGTGPSVSRNSVYDPTTGLVLVVESGTTLSALDPSGTMTWLPVTVAGLSPVSRLYDACAFDPSSGRMILTGGIIPGQLASVLPRHDLWAIQVVPSSLVGISPEASPAGLKLAGANPAHDDVRLSLNLPRAARVVIGIHDPMGRRLRSIDEGALSAGAHPLIWDAKDAAGRRVPAGIYFVRVEAGGDVFTRRVVLLD